MSKIIHTGKVVDEGGQPLYQAHIITTNSTPRRFAVTDQGGNFTVEGDLHEAFEITHIGFRSQIFRLDRYMGNKTYFLRESVEELDEVVVTPRNPVPQKPPRNNDWLGDVFGVIGDIFADNGQVFNTPGFNPAHPKVPTYRAPVVLNPQLPTTGPGSSPTRVPTRHVPPTKKGLADWLEENPLQAGGLLFAAIVLGSLLLKKKSNGTEAGTTEPETLEIEA